MTPKSREKDGCFGCFIVLCVVAVAFYLFILIFSLVLKNDINKGKVEKTVVNIDGNTFTINIEESSNPEYESLVKLFIDDEKTPFLEAKFNGYFASEKQITKLYVGNDLKVYRFAQHIIYKKNNLFYKFHIFPFKNETLDNKKNTDKDISRIAHLLRGKYGWKYILIFAEQMVKTHDGVFISDMKRIVKQELNDAEKYLLNMDYDRAVELAQKLLKKYSIMYPDIKIDWEEKGKSKDNG